MKTYVGIDNGVSGSIGVIDSDGSYPSFRSMGTVFGQDYTKTKKNVSRINFVWFVKFLSTISGEPVVVLERPMVNPGRFMATASAMRALEATLIALESAKFPYQFIDSKEWQRELLPKGLAKGETKKASLDIGCRLFPTLSEAIHCRGDADGILIAEWARRNKR